MIMFNLIDTARRAISSRRSQIELALLSVVGLVPVHRFRVAVLRLFGATVDPQAVVSHGFQVRAPARLVIGARTNVGENAILDARGGLVIGRNVNLSSQVHIWTAQHAWNSPDFAYMKAPVTIGENVWIGPRVTVLPGAVIGDGAVIAAGAVVSGKVEQYALYAGVPAKRIADRTQDLDYELPGPSDKSLWW
jgi:acetyltransferase-like isoleucine patch superfamily enzyme